MTDRSQSCSAAARVFAIPELLECILLNTLNPNISFAAPQAKYLFPIFFADPQAKHLFPAHRVNSTFRSCIAESPELQRRLGLGTFTKQDDYGQTSKMYDDTPPSLWERRRKIEKVIRDTQKVNQLFFKHSGHFDFIAKVTLPGLERFSCRLNYFDNDRTSDPSLVIRFRRINAPRLLDALAQCSPSWINMYPHHSTNSHVVLEVDTKIIWKIPYTWEPKANITVKLCTLEDLILLAVSFQNAADSLEQFKEDYFRLDGKGRVAKFEWKAYFSEEQFKMVVGEPRFSGSNNKFWGVQSAVS